MALTFVFVSLRCALIFAEVSSKLSKGPQNTVARQGEQVILSAEREADGRVIWTAESSNSTKIDISDGYRLNPKVRGIEGYNISPNTFLGKSNLMFTASSDKALTYTVTEIRKETDSQSPEAIDLDSQSAEVIVLEANPRCFHELLSSSSVSLVCALIYSGNWRPTMQWRINGILSNSSKQLQSNTSNPQEIKLLLSISYDDFYKGDGKFECLTYFSRDAYNGTATAKNVPPYKNTCPVSPDKKNKNLPNSASSLHWAWILVAVLAGIAGIAGIIIICALVCIRIRKKLCPPNSEEQERMNRLPTEAGKLVSNV